MAGSFDHITDKKGRFLGTELLDNLGDAYEALEECYYMIHVATKGNVSKMRKLEEEARKIYGTNDSPGNENGSYEGDEEYIDGES